MTDFSSFLWHYYIEYFHSIFCELFVYLTVVRRHLKLLSCGAQVLQAQVLQPI